MDDLSLKPKKTQEEKPKIDTASSRKVTTILLFAIVTVSLLAFYLLAIRKMYDEKVANDAVKKYKDTTGVVVKIDTVYLPGKVVETNFEGCYDVSDCNTIHISIKNGVVEVSNAD